jgi:hypothetical protein
MTHAVRRAGLLLALVATVAWGARPPPAAVGPQPVTAPAPAPSGELGAPAPPSAPGYTPLARTKESGCQARGPLPDPACTPGAVMTNDLDTICHQATGPRRNVPASVHQLAFTEYGYTYPQAKGTFEVDRLIPLGSAATTSSRTYGPSRPRRRRGSTRRTSWKTICTSRCAPGQ